MFSQTSSGLLPSTITTSYLRKKVEEVKAASGSRHFNTENKKAPAVSSH
jgi:hypothetical protein